MTLSLFTIFVLFIILGVSNHVGKINLIYLYTYVITFQTITLDFGLQITPERLVALFMIGNIMLNPWQYKINQSIISFITYATFISVIMAFFLPEYSSQFPLLRGKLRWLFQLLYLIIAFAPIVFFVNHINNLDTIKKVINIFIISCTTQAILSLVQLSSYKFLGIDPFPLDLYNPLREDTNIAEFTFKQFDIFRVCALGGEPKNLAYTMCFGIIFLINKIYLLKHSYWEYILVTLMILVIFLTWSTQGLFLLGIIFLISPLIVFLIRPKRSITPMLKTFMLILISTVIIQQTGLTDLLIYRTIDRISQDSKTAGAYGIEDFDAIIIAFLNNNPFFALLGTGLGNVHFHSRAYIPKELLYYTEKSVYVSKKGIIRLVSEVGIVGLFLYTRIYLQAIHKLIPKPRNKTMTNDNLYISTITITALIIYFIASDGPPYNYFYLALVLAQYKISIA